MILHIDVGEHGEWGVRSDRLPTARAMPPPWRRDELFLVVLDEFRQFAGPSAADRDFENLTQHALRLGGVLAATLLPAEVAHLRAVARTGETPLLVIESDDDALLSLPWELLRIGNRWVVRDGWLDVVRCVRVPDAPLLPVPTEPVSLLVNVSAPAGSVLDYEKESHSIRVATQDNVAVLVNEMGEVRDLLSALAAPAAPRAVHFSGHGGPAQLLFENELGGGELVPVHHLVAAMREATHGRLPHLFYLATCFGADLGDAAAGTITSTAAELHRSGVTQVVAHVGPVGDVVATRVATAFYRAVGSGKQTTTAVREARAQMWNEVTDPLAWALLVLYHRGPDHPLGIAAADDRIAEAARPVFIGRRRELHRLRAAIARGQSSHLVHGMAGVGKSAFCEATRETYRQRGWTNQIVVRCREVASSANPAEALQAAVAGWARAVPLLLVFDDLDALLEPRDGVVGRWRDAAVEALWNTFVDRSERRPRRFALLASSRYQVDVAPPLFPLPPMQWDEMHRMIGWHRPLRRTAPGWRETLVDRLAGNPRALQIASDETVVQRTAAGEVEYEWWQIVEPALRGTQRRFVEDSAFAVLWRDLLDAQSRRLLLSACVLRRPAPKALVLALAPDPADAEQSFELLRRASLLVSTPDGEEAKYHVHPFVERAAGSVAEASGFVFFRIAEDAHEASGKWLAEAHRGDALSAGLQDAAYHLLQAGYVKWSFFLAEQTATELFLRNEAERLVAVLRPYFVQPTYRHLEEQAADLEILQASALHTMGKLDEAVAHAGRARALLDRRLQNADPDPKLLVDLANALEKIAILQKELGNRPAALRSFQRALVLRRRLAAMAPDDLLRQRGPSLALGHIGDLHQEAHDFPAALASYQASLEIVEQLVARDPDSLHWQRDVAISFRKMASLEKRVHGGQLAERFWEQALEMTIRMADADPANKTLRRDLSIAYNDLGDHYENQGKIPQAHALFEKSLAIRQDLIETGERNVTWQHDLANSYKRLSWIAAARGAATLGFHYLQEAWKTEQRHADPERAPRRCLEMFASLSFYLGLDQMVLGQKDAGAGSLRASLRYRQRLAALDPSNAEAQEDVVSALSALATAEGDRERYDAAEALFEQAFALAKGMARQYPASTSWQRDLAAVFMDRGGVLFRKGDHEEAGKAFEHALTIRRRLSEAEPSSAMFRRDLAGVLTEMGELREKRGDLAAAREAYESALTMHRELAAADPDQHNHLDRVASACRKLGRFEYQHGDKQRARSLCDEALRIRKRLLEADPASASRRYELLLVEQAAATFLEDANDSAASARELTRIAAELQMLVEREPHDVDWQTTLAATHERLGELHLLLNAPGDAVASATRALGMRTALAERSSTLQVDLWRAYDLLARAQMRVGNRTGAALSTRAAMAILSRLRMLNPADLASRDALESMKTRLADLQ